MAIQNAIRFIKHAAVDEQLRDAMNNRNGDSIIPDLSEMGYEFTLGEFEEAFNRIHVKCQSEFEAEKLKHLKLWFYLNLD